jgi:protein involved in polysaccharide export with SLBB domain
MRRLLPLVAVLATLTVPRTVCGQAADTTVAVLRPGDVVKISVWRKPELSGEFTVASNGAIADPFYSEVTVVGVPLATVTDRVRQYVSRIEASPRVWVEPRFRVSLGGEVRTPNLYSLSPETTIAQAVALAGGPTERGRLDRVVLLRNGRTELLDLTDPGDQRAAISVRSGDQLLVGRRSSIFRDYIAPGASLVGAVGVVVNLIWTR